MKGSIRRKKNRSARPKSVMLDSEMVTIIVYYVVFHIIIITHATILPTEMESSDIFL